MSNMLDNLYNLDFQKHKGDKLIGVVIRCFVLSITFGTKCSKDVFFIIECNEV